MQNYWKWDLPSKFCGYNEIWSRSAGPQSEPKRTCSI